MKIVHYHANDRFDKIMPVHQSVNSSKRPFCYVWELQRFAFVHPVNQKIKFRMFPRAQYCFEHDRVSSSRQKNLERETQLSALSVGNNPGVL